MQIDMQEDLLQFKHSREEGGFSDSEHEPGVLI